MASVPSVTLDKIDLVIGAVADRIIREAVRDENKLRDVSDAFREFAGGISMLLGLVPVPEGAVLNASTEETS